MKLGIIIFLIGLLIGAFQSCGSIPDDTRFTCCRAPSVPSDQAFESYVKDFEWFSNMSTRHIPIYFADLQTGTAGICHYLKFGDMVTWGYIEVDKENWESMTELQKENLIFHELGHCVLGRGHTEWQIPNECPSSYMYKAVMSNYCLEKYYYDYIGEMFPTWSFK